MKVVLIANNPKADVPSEGFDLYVHFNHAHHWGKTPLDKSIILIRKTSIIAKNNRFNFGELENFRSKIIVVGWTKDVRNIDANIPLIPVECVPDYPKGHSPSTGFVGIYYYLSRGDDVTLCGFDIRSAKYFSTVKLHKLQLEAETVDEMKNAGILSSI